MSAATSSKRKALLPQGLGYNLLALTLVVALCGLALAYAVDSASRNARIPQHRFDSETTLARVLGGKELHVPLSWFRDAEQGTAGFSKQIELQLMLPLGPDNAVRSVDITLLPRSSLRTSAALLDGVYLHLFTAEQRTGAAGLVGKPLRAEGGYAAETVWYDPISADPFVAKCEAPVSEGHGRCLRSVHLAPGIAAVYAFDAELLERWRDFDASIRPYLTRIGVIAP